LPTHRPLRWGQRALTMLHLITAAGHCNACAPIRCSTNCVGGSNHPAGRSAGGAAKRAAAWPRHRRLGRTGRLCAADAVRGGEWLWLSLIQLIHMQKISSMHCKSCLRVERTFSGMSIICAGTAGRNSRRSAPRLTRLWAACRGCWMPLRIAEQHTPADIYSPGGTRRWIADAWPTFSICSLTPIYHSGT